MKLLDTNVILYALGRPHPYKAACSRLLERIAAGSIDGAIDAELLQEVLYVYAARGERQRGLTAFDDLLIAFPTPIPVTREELLLARRMMEEVPQLSPRDAIHAAVVQSFALEGIVTTDRVFQQVRDLQVFDPRDLTADT